MLAAHLKGGGLGDDMRCLHGDRESDRREQEECERDVERLGHLKFSSVFDLVD